MTGEELLTIALDLCGLRKEDGTKSCDTQDLSLRALSLINLLLAENAVLDCKIRRCEHKTERISSLSDRISCSDIIAWSVLPYGLCRLLMTGEDDDFAAEMNRLYLNAREEAIRFGKARAMPITEVYR